MNVKETGKQDSSEKLIERERMENTPFVLIKEEEGYFLTLGQYKVTETKETREEIEELITGDKTNWEFLMTVIGTIIEITNNNK